MDTTGAQSTPPKNTPAQAVKGCVPVQRLRTCSKVAKLFQGCAILFKGRATRPKGRVPVHALRTFSIFAGSHIRNSRPKAATAEGGLGRRAAPR